MFFFGEQAIDQPDRLHRFAVINGADFDAGLPLELFQNRFGIDLVLGGVNDHRARRLTAASGYQPPQEDGGQKLEEGSDLPGHSQSSILPPRFSTRADSRNGEIGARTAMSART